MNTLSFKVSQETADFLTCIVELENIHTRILNLQYKWFATEDVNISDSLLEGFGIIEACLFDSIKETISANVADITNSGDVVKI